MLKFVRKEIKEVFYKIIYNHIVIDVIENPRWVLWSAKRKQFMMTDKITANGIVASDCSAVYHIDGKKDFTNRTEVSKNVTVAKISEIEYIAIKSQIKNKTINEHGDIVSIDQLKEQKISQMSQACEDKITRGFDMILSDGVQHHFSLQLTDQLKITKLNDRAVAGMDFLPYHADNEPCKIYTAEEIIALNRNMEYIIEYETTYFNSLKLYINNMTDKNDIINFKYGDEIPLEYQSDVLKMFNNRVDE